MKRLLLVLLFLVSGFVSVVANATENYCNGAKKRDTSGFYYPNGRHVIDSWGTYYPEGQKIIDSWGLYYPNGHKVRDAWGVYYPNGQKIYDTWGCYLPNGSEVENCESTYRGQAQIDSFGSVVASVNRIPKTLGIFSFVTHSDGKTLLIEIDMENVRVIDTI